MTPAGAGADNAGVRVPPPLIYLATFGIGWLIQRGAPRPIIAAGEARWAGSVLVVAWAAITAWTVTCFRRHRTSLVPVKPASALIVRGPFGVTRNPLYLGMVLLYAGMAFWLDALWPLVLLLPLVFVIQAYAIAREERYLARRFGDAYLDYCRRVRRWI
ncbi:MAG: isoprenylcysteine carboxylmethyltransferase family protein [Gemmatimonadota bacterium]|nr:isoprenylcysteine carboxylmethyltransferase family protein [Gemmatimonadota bacterium]MDE3127850.1 isoprenylcysteine carboxylmethyltransferase family protein [Gemmatimonadota bacterium]MDE3173153.1 isoprenylcysteine carboxylmethyltransferase family protein [Gemmatimonadota bacterium]MDE3215135.1 isoprenylcysteine carboxylmethyltransferase family protein [Gemmatimonadota bacterium]